jgi:hypothetical protein
MTPQVASAAATFKFVASLACTKNLSRSCIADGEEAVVPIQAHASDRSQLLPSQTISIVVEARPYPRCDASDLLVTPPAGPGQAIITHNEADLSVRLTARDVDGLPIGDSPVQLSVTWSSVALKAALPSSSIVPPVRDSKQGSLYIASVARADRSKPGQYTLSVSLRDAWGEGGAMLCGLLNRTFTIRCADGFHQEGESCIEVRSDVRRIIGGVVGTGLGLALISLVSLFVNRNPQRARRLVQSFLAKEVTMTIGVASETFDIAGDSICLAAAVEADTLVTPYIACYVVATVTSVVALGYRVLLLVQQWRSRMHQMKLHVAGPMSASARRREERILKLNTLMAENKAAEVECYIKMACVCPRSRACLPHSICFCGCVLVHVCAHVHVQACVDTGDCVCACVCLRMLASNLKMCVRGCVQARLCVCVRVRACVCARARVRVWVYVCARGCVCGCVSACVCVSVCVCGDGWVNRPSLSQMCALGRSTAGCLGALLARSRTGRLFNHPSFHGVYVGHVWKQAAEGSRTERYAAWSPN